MKCLLVLMLTLSQFCVLNDFLLCNLICKGQLDVE